MLECRYALGDLVTNLLNGKDAGYKEVIAYGIPQQQECEHNADSQPKPDPAITAPRVLLSADSRVHRSRIQQLHQPSETRLKGLSADQLVDMLCNSYSK
jgi:hypothetical protein